MVARSTRRLKRRTFLKSGAAITGAGVFGALWGVRPATSLQGGAAIRIGFIPPLSGTVSQSGRDMLDGFQLHLTEVNSVMADRLVELIVEDTGGSPANALAKTRSLVEGDRVHILVGPLLASEGYAIRDYVTARSVPTLFPVVSADDITQRKRSPNIIRTGWSSSQPSHPFGEWVATALKYRRIATVGDDYAFAYEVVGGFQRTFEQHGGEIVQKMWVPLGAPDFGSHVNGVRRDVDAIFVATVGADSVKVVQAYRRFGLKDRIPLLGAGTLTDESVLRGMLPEEAMGVVTPLMWSAGLGSPEAKRFVAAYTLRFQKSPSYYAEACYTCARWIGAAVQQVGGAVENSAAFLQALRAVQLLDAPRGPIRLDAYQNPIQNIYVRKVERQDGRLVNAVTNTFHNVSQFWTVPPAEFLKQPVYSRTYPPCGYCG